MWTAPVASMPFSFRLGRVIGRPGRKLGRGGDWGQEIYPFPIAPSRPPPSILPAGWLTPKATAHIWLPSLPGTFSLGPRGQPRGSLTLKPLPSAASLVDPPRLLRLRTVHSLLGA